MIREKGSDEEAVSVFRTATELKPDDEKSGGMIKGLMR